jgi:hypothetical protein
MGLPLRFDHDVTAHWRGLSDLSQVTGSARNYTAESQFSNATPADLRQTVVGDIPETILARYTVLPADIPDRVIQLAREAALADNETPPSMYDQVQAIEQFLRQYPYSLDLPTHPRNQDLVDYFLFDLQTGYCDYYATSMVVMARSLGFPARFATGFLAQPPDENGVQHIYQLNAHSWAEIYFAGYGWIEFEPTAPFPTQSESDGFTAFQPSEPPEFALTEPMALPPATVPNPGSVLTNSYFLVIFFLFLVAVGTMAWFMRVKRETQDSVLSAYGRLLRSANAIGSATPESQTPIEFEATFKNRLGQMTAASKLAGSLIQKRPNQENESGLPDAAAQLTDLFIAHQYRPPGGFNGDDLGLKARLIWRRIRLRLWLLTLLNKLRRVVGK